VYYHFQTPRSLGESLLKFLTYHTNSKSLGGLEMKHMILTGVVACFIGMVSLLSSTTVVNAGDCWVTTPQGVVCPPPPAIKGKVTSSAKFKRECVWLPFPVGTVEQPIVFFTKVSDSRCIGKNWRRPCPDCQAWIHPDRPRGEVNGPAAQAVLAVRLHNNMNGISVPRADYNRIARETGWCDFGKSRINDSHSFNESPW